MTSFKDIKGKFDKINKEKGGETNSMLDIEGDDFLLEDLVMD